MAGPGERGEGSGAKSADSPGGPGRRSVHALGEVHVLTEAGSQTIVQEAPEIGVRRVGDDTNLTVIEEEANRTCQGAGQGVVDPNSSWARRARVETPRAARRPELGAWPAIARTGKGGPGRAEENQSLQPRALQRLPSWATMPKEAVTVRDGVRKHCPEAGHKVSRLHGLGGSIPARQPRFESENAAGRH